MKIAAHKPAPGWIGRVARDALTTMQAGHSPDFWAAQGYPVTAPISAEEAAALYRRLDDRFLAWTGKSLREHAAEQAL